MLTDLMKRAGMMQQMAITMLRKRQKNARMKLV